MTPCVGLGMSALSTSIVAEELPNIGWPVTVRWRSCRCISSIRSIRLRGHRVLKRTCRGMERYQEQAVELATCACRFEQVG